MRGDKLASGERSASFSVAPGLRFSEGQMRDDIRALDPESFMLKYMITQREYDMLVSTTDEAKISAFAEEMQQHAEFYERQVKQDVAQEDTLRRDCFITPFVPMGIIGRVIVNRDGPVDKPSPLVIPKSLRKDKTLLPTTGHIIKAVIYQTDDTGACSHVGSDYIGQRILFSQMSGVAICFKNYPTWILLELSEILAVVNKEDSELEEETLEPMV